jgi:hypothetical protein
MIKSLRTDLPKDTHIYSYFNISGINKRSDGKMRLKIYTGVDSQGFEFILGNVSILYL